MNLQLSSSPLVSVVIPVYNGEMHISVCMDSILCQSFSSFEAIFVDDGSVDNSFRILSERASFDRRMKVIRQENMGVTCARRNGVKLYVRRNIKYIISQYTFSKKFCPYYQINLLFK